MLSTGRGVRGKGSPMSSTKLYDESAMTSSEGDDDERPSAADEARRRYLMRYVVAVIGFSATICLAAGVRMAVARPGSADNASPPASIVHESTPVVPTPTNATSEALPPAADPPVLASPAAAAPVRPTAAQPVVPQAHAAAPAESLPLGRTPRAAPHPKSHVSGIERRAPF